MHAAGWRFILQLGVSAMTKDFVDAGEARDSKLFHQKEPTHADDNQDDADGEK